MSSNKLTVSLIGVDSRDYVYFGKYYKAVQKLGKLVLQRVLLDLFSFESQGSEKTLKEYCVSSMGYTNTKLRTIFKKDLPKLDFKLNGDGLDGDVSFYFKVIYEIFTNIPDVFLEKLRLLKVCRNFLCHEDAVVDEKNFTEKIGSLKDLCISILQEVVTITGKSTDDLTKLIDQEIDDLVSTNDVDSLNTHLENNIDSFIREGRKELKKAYSKFKILNPCCWLNDEKFKNFTVDNVFTELRLTKTSEEVKIEDILNIVDSRFVVHLIVISGLAGSGKSSLLRYLVNQWSLHSNIVLGLTGFDLVLFINLAKVTCSSLQSYILQELMPITFKDVKPEDIISIMQNMNVLFLLDAYDESSVQSKSLTKEILAKFSACSKIVITSRPEYTVELKLLDGNHLHFQVLGFNDNNIREYARKVMGVTSDHENDEKNSVELFLKYLSTVGKCLGQYLNLPLTIALLIVLWQYHEGADGVHIKTATTLYEEIMNMCKLKLIWRLKEKYVDHQLKLEASVQTWFEHLCEIAWELLMEDELVLSNEKARKLMAAASESNLDEIQTMSSFFNCEVSEASLGTTYTFSFLHNSVQEFLAAKHLVSKLTNNSNERDSRVITKSLYLSQDGQNFRTLNSYRLSQSIIYTLGLLSKDPPIPMHIADYLINACLVKLTGFGPNSTRSWHKLITETDGDAAAGQIIGGIITSNAIWSVKNGARYISTDVYLRLLQTTSAAPKMLMIEIDYEHEVSDVPDLKELIQLCSVSKVTMMNVFFQKQYNVSSYSETMDELIVPLLSSNLVENLIGHGGPATVKALRFATRLTSLQLRVSSTDALKQLNNVNFSSFTPTLLNDLARRRLSKVFSNRYSLRKRKLTMFELFIDMKPESFPEQIPYLNYTGKLIVKFSVVNAEHVTSIAKFLANFHRNYASVIFMNSTLNVCDLVNILKKSKPANISELQIHQSQVRSTVYSNLPRRSNKSVIPKKSSAVPNIPPAIPLDLLNDLPDDLKTVIRLCAPTNVH